MTVELTEGVTETVKEKLPVRVGEAVVDPEEVVEADGE